MPEIDVTIAGRNYRVACDPGEEAHLADAARTLAEEAERLRASGGPALTESRLLLLSALIVSDRLNGAEAKLRASEEAQQKQEAALRAADDQLRQIAESPPPVPQPSQGMLFAEETAERAITLLESTAERLEALAAEVEEKAAG
ncbi:MAG: cell division protein ZapA [Alphaproteobacteria bacterium]|nr:MAG: cell division protein ZapA [Alphaproteobacteria bacterium]